MKNTKRNHCIRCKVSIPLNQAICKKCNQKQMRLFTKYPPNPTPINKDVECRKYLHSSPSSLEKAQQANQKYIFAPDKELINFANEFSKVYKKVKPGIYASKSEKYLIWYKKKILMQFIGKELNTPIRISIKKQIIEISRSKILKNKNYSTDFIFFLILWCIAIVENPNHEYQEADKQAIRYYLTTKRSRKNILKGYIEMFRFSPAICRNKQRLICVKKLLYNGKRI